MIAVPDKRLGEELCACIKLKADEKMTEDELKAFCKGKISHFKVPRYIEFTDDFPLTISGKIQKNKLRERMIKKLKL
jgi:acyl-CoA synthetase (AMP-forming)/AMP-acid ligase II